jgi:hypothetical protein
MFILMQEILKGLLKALLSRGGKPMKRVPTTSYFWVSRLAGFVGIVCMVLAVVTSVTEHHLATDPAEWVQIAIAAFIFAIWAVLYELRDQGVKTK